MPLKLIVVDVPFNLRKLLPTIIAAYAGVELECAKGFMPPDGKTEEFRRKCHPLQKSPVLETPEGNIFESGAISRYLARLGEKNNAGLLGRTVYESGLVDQWYEFANSEMGANLWPLIYHAKFKPQPEEVLKEKTAALHATFAGLDLWIGDRAHLVGDQVTLADIAIAVAVDASLTFGDAKLHTEYPNVMRHYQKMMREPKVIQGMEACGKSAQPAEKPSA